MGAFKAKLDTLVHDALARHAPDIWAAGRRAVAAGRSVDLAVAEKLAGIGAMAEMRASEPSTPLVGRGLPAVIRTVARDGTIRHWGVCLECAFVDELAEFEPWVGICAECAEDQLDDGADEQALRDADYRRAVAPR